MSMFNGQCSMFNVQCSKMRLSEGRDELVRAMPSVSILGEANGQCSMVNGQCSIDILGGVLYPMSLKGTPLNNRRYMRRS